MHVHTADHDHDNDSPLINPARTDFDIPTLRAHLWDEHAYAASWDAYGVDMLVVHFALHAILPMFVGM